jgi:hypothetical protein
LLRRPRYETEQHYDILADGRANEIRVDFERDSGSASAA